MDHTNFAVARLTVAIPREVLTVDTEHPDHIDQMQHYLHRAFENAATISMAGCTWRMTDEDGEMPDNKVAVAVARAHRDGRYAGLMDLIDALQYPDVRDAELEMVVRTIRAWDKATLAEGPEVLMEAVDQLCDLHLNGQPARGVNPPENGG